MHPLSSKPAEQLCLFEAALSPSATEAELRELELLLAQDPDAVDRYAEFTQQDVELRHAFRIGLVEPSASTSGVQQLTRSDAQLPPAGAPPRRPLVASLGGLAVCVALVIAIHRWADPPVAMPPAPPPVSPMAPVAFTSIPPAPIATVTLDREARWQGTQLVDGQSLSEGDRIELVEGTARISMGFGAEITAKGPCALEFVANDRVELKWGEVAVHVAEWARGFTVVTPAMEVVDLGTTFTVSAASDSSAETNVIKGQVRVSPRHSADDGLRSVLVSEGEILRVDLDGHRSTRSTSNADLNHWGEWVRHPPYRPISVHNTGHDINVGDEDPNWRVIAGPEDSFSGPQFAVVCVPDVRYLPNERETSQWVSMANWRNATPNSIFTFQTTFNLTGFDLKTTQLFGRFLADNGIREVRVNGKAAELESWSDNASGQKFEHPQFRTVNVTSGLVDGTNVIEVDVWNGTFVTDPPKPTPNPMALRVEWQAFGRMSSSQWEVTRLSPLFPHQRRNSAVDGFARLTNSPSQFNVAGRL